MVTDCMQKFLFVDQSIRGVHVCMPKTVSEIMQQHHYPPVLHQSFGSCLVATVLLINRLKFSGELSLQLQTNGCISLLVAKCNHQLHVRGLAQWDQAADSQQLEADFFDGRLSVTLSADDSTQPFQSIVDLNRQSVAQALEHYFLQSEQLATLILLDIEDTLGSGLLLQRMPEADSDQVLWADFKSRLNALPIAELALPTEQLLTRHFSEFDIELYPPKPVQFQCSCSDEKMRFAVQSMGKEEAEKLLLESPTIVVTCEYCNTEYEITEVEVRSFFSD